MSDIYFNDEKTININGNEILITLNSILADI